MKKEPDNRDKLKIASFRTTDGDWFDFCQVAESNGLTATDVLKACMVEYQAGTYTPAINTPVSMRLQAAQGLTAEEVQGLINTAISTRTHTTPTNGDLTQWDDLKAEVKHLQGCLRDTATIDYIERALEPVSVAIESIRSTTATRDYLEASIASLTRVIDAVKNNLDDLWADVEALKTAVKVAATARKLPGELKTLSKDEENQLKKMRENPAFLERAIEGVNNGLVGGALNKWLADGGIFNGKGNPFDAAVISRIKTAVLWHLATLEPIEYLDNQEQEQTND